MVSPNGKKKKLKIFFTKLSLPNFFSALIPSNPKLVSSVPVYGQLSHQEKKQSNTPTFKIPCWSHHFHA
jgi:hypothetical protein